jgi:hypothetical protein
LNKLEEVKKLAENHMKETVKLQQNIMELNFNEVTEFNEWYKNHPYQQEMNNIFN